MKFLLTMIIPLVSEMIFGQGNIAGNYAGNRMQLRLNEDHSFVYFENNCTNFPEASGHWIINKDTLLLTSESPAGFNRIIQISGYPSSIKGLEVWISDPEGNTCEDQTIVVAFEGKFEARKTHWPCTASFDLPLADSIKVSEYSWYPVPDSLAGKNDLRIVFSNIDIENTANFSETPFVIRGKKIHPFYTDGSGVCKCFMKKQKIRKRKSS